MSSTNSGKPNWRTGYTPARRTRQEWRGRTIHRSGVWQALPRKVRLALAGVLFIGLTALLVYYLWLPSRVAVPRLVLVGIGSYNDRAFPPNDFARADVAAFETLKNYDPLQFAQSGDQLQDWADILTGDALLDRIHKQLAAMPEKSLVVFCSLHGTVRPGEGGDDAGEAQFFAIDAKPDGVSTPGRGMMVSIPSLLEELGKTSAQSILVLIDAGRLGPNWRLGVLANDFPSQLERDVEAFDRKTAKNANATKLRVICAAGPQETSWTSEQWRESVFAHFVIEGLKGQADGQREDKKSPQRRDNRIDADELFAYVKAKVGEWSLNHRGVPQTVRSFGKSDFTVAIVNPAVPKGPSEKKDAAETPAVAGAKERKDQKDAPQEKQEKPAATTKTVVKAEPKEGPQKEGSQADPVFDDKLWAEIDALWKKRDDHRRTGNAVRYAPHCWRAIQSHLVLAEQALRGGETKMVGKCLETVRSLFAEIDRRTDAGPLFDRRDGALPILTLGMASLMKPPSLPAPAQEKLAALAKAALDGMAEDERKKSLDALRGFLAENQPASPIAPAAPAAAGAANAKKADETNTTVAAASFQAGQRNEDYHVTKRRALAEWIWARATTAPDATTQSGLVRLAPLLALIPEREWPLELNLLVPLVQLGRDWPADRNATPWNAVLCQTALKVETAAEQAAVADPQVFPWIRDLLHVADVERQAGEQWLLAGGSLQGQAVARLDKAAAAYAPVREAAGQTAAAYRLYEELLAELPDFAFWMAQRAERADAGSNGRDDAFARRRIVEQFQDRQFLEQWQRLGGAADFAPGAVGNTPDAALLQLFATARTLGELLARPDATARERLRTLVAEGAARSTAFRGQFETQVREVLNDRSLTPRRWRDVDDLLRVPWIDSASRRELRVQLARIAEAVDANSGLTAAAYRSESAPGVWHGFWAIQTVTLGRTDVETEPALWNRWLQLAAVKEGAANELGVERERIKLGREINRAWSQIAARVNDPAAALPAASADADAKTGRLSTQEELLRVLHGMDAGLDDALLRDRDPVGQRRKRDLLALLHAQRLRWSEWSTADAPRVALAQRFETVATAVVANPPAAPEPLPIPIRIESFEPKDVLDGPRPALVVLTLRGAATAFEPGRDPEVHLEYDPVEVIVTDRDGKKPGSVVPKLASPNATLQLQYDVKLASGRAKRRQSLVAVLSVPGLPLQLRSVSLNPPDDYSGWRIVFEPASGQRVKTPPQVQSARFHLPPAGDYSLKVHLERPEAEIGQAEKVQVTVFRNAGGATGYVPFLDKQEIAFLPDQLRAPLALTFPPAPAVPAPGAAKPQAVEAAAGKEPAPPDVSQGLRFEIRLPREGAQPIVREIVPELYGAEEMILPPDVKFEGGRLLVRVARGKDGTTARRNDIVDYFPQPVSAALRLPPALNRPNLRKDDNLITPPLRPGDKAELYAEFFPDGIAEVERDPHEIAVEVAGVAHAFRYRIRCQEKSAGELVRGPRLKILRPQPRDAFKRGDDVDVEFEMYDVGPSTEPLVIKLALVTDPATASPARPLKDWQFRSPLETQVGLTAIKKELWTFRTATHDPVRTVPGNEISQTGRRFLCAWLYRGGQLIDKEMQQVEIAFDDSPPKLEFPSQPTVFPANAAVVLRVDANDPQSGIRELVWGIDANNNGKLEENETNPDLKIENPRGTVSIHIPPELLPVLPPGKDKLSLQILARATNGIKLANKEVAFKINLVQPQQANPAALGTLTITINRRFREKTIILTGPENRPPLPVPDGALGPFTFDRLPPGEYTIEVIGTYHGKKEKVRVNAGKPTPVVMELTQ